MGTRVRGSDLSPDLSHHFGTWLACVDFRLERWATCNLLRCWDCDAQVHAILVTVRWLRIVWTNHAYFSGFYYWDNNKVIPSPDPWLPFLPLPLPPLSFSLPLTQLGVWGSTVSCPGVRAENAFVCIFTLKKHPLAVSRPLTSCRRAKFSRLIARVQSELVGQYAQSTGRNLRTTGTFVPVVMQLKYSVWINKTEHFPSSFCPCQLKCSLSVCL